MAPTDLEQLQALLVEEQLDDVAKTLKSPDDFAPALTGYISSPGGKKTELLDRARLLAQLWGVVCKNVAIMRYLSVKSREDKCSNLADIASKWFTRPDEFKNRSEWYGYRDAIAEVEPTASYRCLVNDGHFPVPEAGSKDIERQVQIAVVGMFDACLNQGLDISRDSTTQIIEKFRTAKQNEADSKVSDLAISLFQSIQRLQAVVRYPEHAALCVQFGVHSAQDIARSSDKDLEPLAIKINHNESFRRMQEQALLIETRNEQSWLRLLQSRSQLLDSELVTPSIKTDVSSGDEKMVGPMNYQKIFKEIDNAACEHCTSVLSPSAYFVDLLRLMHDTKVQPDAGPAGIKPADKPQSSKDGHTLLYKFFERRGDLQNLKLSCANTNDLIEYVDLVHEVLQSFTAALAGEGGKFTDNTHKNAESYHNRTQLNIEGDVWFDYEFHQKVTRKQVYPISNFPFNFATVSTRLFLDTLGSSLSEVYSIFSSPYRVFAGMELTASPNTKRRIAQLAIDRALASERLGLSPEEFMLLARESFYSREAMELQRLSLGVTGMSSYLNTLGMPALRSTDWASVDEWGYDVFEDYIPQKEGKSGLMFVQTQLLPRSGLNFEELLLILKSQFMARQLVLVSASGSFTGRLDDLRLRRIPDATNTSNAVNEFIYLELLKFTRLYQKIQWPIPDLDCALTGLARMITGSKATRSIDASLLVHLSWVKQAKELTNLPISQLMVLWNDMDASHSNSLYYTLFATQRTVKNGHLFLPDSDGTILGQFAELQDGCAVIATGMGISETELAQLMIVCSLDPLDDLNLSNVSKLYRYWLFAKILKLDLLQLGVVAGQSKSALYFQSPEATHIFVSNWEALIATGLSADDTCALLAPFYHKSGQDRPEGVAELTKYAAHCRHSAKTRDDVKTAVLKDDSKILEEVLAMALDHSENTMAIIDSTNWTSKSDPAVFKSVYLVSKGSIMLVVPKSVVDDDSGFADRITVGGKPLLFAKDATGSYISMPIDCKDGRAQYLEEPEGRDLRKLAIVLQSTGVREPVEPFLRPTTVVRKFADAVHAVSVTVKVLQHFKITSSEAVLLTGAAPGGFGVRLSQAGLEDLFMLRKFVSLRDSIKTKNKSPKAFESLFSSLRDLDSNLPQVALNGYVAKFTGAPSTLVQEILQQLYPDMSPLDVRDSLSNIDQIKRVVDIVKFVGRPKFRPSDIKVLFRVADPQHPVRVDRQFTAADDLRNEVKKRYSQAPKGELSLYSGTTRKLVDQCRIVLIKYLLRSEFASKKGLTDADSLFEYFLIDVNMRPGLKTSRIKQAISTVQLYVQRCMLGMEVDNGVGTLSRDHDVRKRWEWCRSYQLWEANRKVFLYPENLADPTLRDDKSEIFKALEARVIQSSLDPDTMTQIIKSYIYEVNTLSDLEVSSYFLEREKKESQRYIKFHLFARTRNAPYNYFYRPLVIALSNTSSESVNYWSPWEKLEIEIPTYETYTDGTALPRAGTYMLPIMRKDRLYLFIPQIMLKTLPSSETNSMQFQDVAKRTASQGVATKYWEIRMGVTEYRNDRWSPKKLSAATIAVKPIDVNQLPEQYSKPENIKTRAVDKSRLPSIDAFKFFIRSENFEGATTPLGKGVEDVLDIDIEAWYPKNIGNEEPAMEDNNRNLDAFVMGFGRFQIREYDIIAIPQSKLDSSFSWSPKRDSTRQTIPTTFSKLKWKCTFDRADPNRSTWARPTNTVYHYGTENTPILPDILAESSSKKEREVTWTMSFDDTQVSRPTGLVVEMVTREEGSLNFLTLPALQVTDDEDEIEPVPMNNNIGPSLMQWCSTIDDIDFLYKKITDGLPAHLTNDAFGASSSPAFHELAKPYSIYNWELSFHAVSLLMERLLATQQLELALHVARFVFDPTGGVADPKQCWRFAPFRDPAITNMKSPALAAESVNATGPVSRDKRNLDTAVDEWRRHPFAAHVVARAFPTAYMKRMVRKYIEILVAMGDKYFREGTLESMPMAIQRYIEAAHLFGERAKTYERFGKAAHKSYNQLMSNLNSFSNSVVDLELEFPFWCNNKYKGSTGTSPRLNEMNKGLLGVLRTGYFCVPQNPELVALRDLIDDRLFKIRNCQDINGKGVQLRLFEPPLDPAALVRAIAGGMSPSAFGDEIKADMPRHRFSYLLQKALEVCAELNTMGDLFVSIKEKKDAEALTAFKGAQEDVISAMVLNTKKHELSEARKTLESLEETRRGHESRLSFYRRLVGEDDKTPAIGTEWNDIIQDIDTPTKDELRMNSNEQIEFYLTDQAEKLNLKASSIDTMAGALRLLPGVEENIEPVGCGVTMKMDGNNIADFMMVTSSVFRLSAEMKNNEAGRASRKAQLIRQLQERRLEANMAGRDIAVLDKQLAAQEIRVKMAESEVSIQEKQIEQSNEMDAWLKNKYSNEQLYNWMANSVAKLFKQGYTFAAELAAQAKRAYEFESGTPPDSTGFGKASYWDDSRDGLFSAQNLWFALKRMEDAFSKDRPHDFELTKAISLRQLHPLALLQLRATGHTVIKVPEIIFDMDFPGHYMRRIKSVGLSIPCIVGPYTGINCELSLTRNTVRMKGTPSIEQEAEATFAIRIKSIATSHGQADTGVFDLAYGTTDTYGPFEGAGVNSDWEVALPSPIPQFDYATISDVVMHMRYTAKAPTSTGKQNAIANVLKFVSDQTKEGLRLMLDLRNEYNAQWRAMNKALQAGSTTATLEFADIKTRLPFWAKGKRAHASKVSVVAEFGVSDPSEKREAPTFKVGETVLASLEELVSKKDQATANSMFVGVQAKAGDDVAATPLVVTVERVEGAAVHVLEKVFVVVEYHIDI